MGQTVAERMSALCATRVDSDSCIVKGWLVMDTDAETWLNSHYPEKTSYFDPPDRFMKELGYYFVSCSNSWMSGSDHHYVHQEDVVWWLIHNYHKERVVEDWPEVDPIDSSWYDHCRMSRDVVVQPYDRYGCKGMHAMWCDGVSANEFTLTTDPADAPDDQEPWEQGPTFSTVAGSVVDMGRFNFNPTPQARAAFSEMRVNNPSPTMSCNKCNGTGEVHGALGVGVMWPCECRK